MSSWRFYPLRDHPRSGILRSPEGEFTICDYLTPAEAKQRALKGVK